MRGGRLSRRALKLIAAIGIPLAVVAGFALHAAVFAPSAAVVTAPATSQASPLALEDGTCLPTLTTSTWDKNYCPTFAIRVSVDPLQLSRMPSVAITKDGKSYQPYSGDYGVVVQSLKREAVCPPNRPGLCWGVWSFSWATDGGTLIVAAQEVAQGNLGDAYYNAALYNYELDGGSYTIGVHRPDFYLYGVKLKK